MVNFSIEKNSKVRNWISYPIVFLIGGLIANQGDPFHVQIALGIAISIILAIAWDILARTGQTSFGHSAFFGLGAYTTAILYPKIGLFGSWFAGISITMIFAFLFGLCVLRLRGLYFAITTLALSLSLQVLSLVFESITGGAAGISPYVLFNGNRRYQLLLVMASLIVSMFVSNVFLKPVPRATAFMIRSHPQLALSSGIPLVFTKVVTFACSGSIAALAGALYGGLYGYIIPSDVFNIHWNVLPLAIALIGGVDTTFGPIIGGILIRVLEEVSKTFIGSSGYQVVVGAVIIGCITLMPKGVLGLIRKLNLRISGFGRKVNA